MSKSIYERVLNLRDRISLDGDDTIYEEDYLLLDEVLNLIENIGGEDTDIETQIYDYNNTVDIYKELEVGATVKHYFELKAKGITTEAEALEHRELLNKINEMVDIDKVREHVSKWTREGRQLMREALNELEAYQIRNKPMKVVKETSYEIGSIQNIHRCPNCSHIVDNHYCSDCGQKLNWSENDE